MSTFGHPRRHYRVTDSTNERARELAQAGAPSGTVVTADAQIAGRGRRGRTWSAPPGKALLFTAILRPLEPWHGLLPLAVPVAVCEAIESLAPVGCRIKWPNDVWIDERKVAGVLIEARATEWAAIGVGVNVAVEPADLPPEVRWPAISVGHGVTVEDAHGTLCASLGRWADASEPTVIEAFEERDALRDRALRWTRAGGDHPDGEGVARGVDRAGNLLVEKSTGERLALGAGEVDLRVSDRPGD